MRHGAFFESSQEIVKKFLSNVVAVDDKLFFGTQVETTSALVEDDFDIAEEDLSGIGATDTLAINHEEIRSNQKDHNLDYQDLNFAFAKDGINCSAFIPRRTGVNSIEDAAVQIMQSVQRADITILDWSMDHDFGAAPGTLAKTSIKKILEQDRSQQGRLRLVAIYTAESDRTGIASQIRSFLTDQDGGGIQATGDDCNITFLNPNLEFCKIVVIEKKVSAEDLRKKVIELFTELTIGLLPNATLSALGELRDKTHHILHTFNKDLDPAYLSHVMGLLSSPKVREKADEVAFDYAIELIAEELKSMVQVSSSLKSSLGSPRITDWLSHINPEEESDFFEIIVGNKSGKVGASKIVKLLSATTNGQIKQALQDAPAIIADEEHPHNFFEQNRIEVKLKNGPSDSHEKLSIIECKRRDGLSLAANPYEPNIKLGSIVKDEHGSYYICLQPLCDSVRLGSDTNFLFLKVSQVTSATGKFTHIIQLPSAEKIKLMVRSSSINIHKFVLQCNKQSRTAKVQRQDDNTYTISHKKDNGECSDLTWIGELKNNVAQAISNSVAASISRVGLDTNEWLRLSSSNH